jgi:ribosomal protein S27AE
MKKQKKGDARGRRNARSSFLAHPDAKFFCGKCGIGSLGENEHGIESLGDFFFLLFLPNRKGAQRPAAVKGRAVFWRGASAPLDGEDRCGIMS